jgi:bis(5'-nucleosyl)-tetraphosphatase (symmetrical)
MATYVIGDLQGCYATLTALLAQVRFRRTSDSLWFVGDIVNRGPGSLECLRFVASPNQNTVVVLGNHDLHLLARAEGLVKAGRLDTLDEVLSATDGARLLDWLRRQKLLHVEGCNAMVHAGLLPSWSWGQSLSLAREVETQLSGPHYRRYLAGMYGDEPTMWQPRLSGADRFRFCVNVFTRMRAIAANGAIDLRYKGLIGSMPTELTPWFDVPSVRRAKRTIYAGHWSAIGLTKREQVVSLDTGCVWGNSLTAVRLDDGKIFQEPCRDAVVRGAHE